MCFRMAQHFRPTAKTENSSGENGCATAHPTRRDAHPPRTRRHVPAAAQGLRASATCGHKFTALRVPAGPAHRGTRGHRDAPAHGHARARARTDTRRSYPAARPRNFAKPTFRFTTVRRHGVFAQYLQGLRQRPQTFLRLYISHGHTRGHAPSLPAARARVTRRRATDTRRAA